MLGTVKSCRVTAYAATQQPAQVLYLERVREPRVEVTG